MSPWDRIAATAARLAPRLALDLAQAQRDVVMVWNGLRGRHPTPLLPRSSTAAYVPHRTSALDSARALRVAAIQRETPDAIRVELEDPNGRSLDFVPGQFFTVLVNLDGRIRRRAYSPASYHRNAARVVLAIKQMPGGRVSRWLNQHLQVGQPLRVLGPSGEFTCAPDPDAARHLVLLAGGSGITPLSAIARAVLADEPASRVTLIYGNRGVGDIIFRAELDALRAEHPTRFTLRHVLSHPPTGWSGGVGLLQRDVVERELAALGEPREPATYFVCGPEPMMAAVREALRDRGVAPERIHEERFRPAADSSAGPAAARPETSLPVTVGHNGTSQIFEVAPGETLLDAALAAGVGLRFSCAMGGCGACRVKVGEGEVAMEEPNCLTAEEREAGYALACVGWPTRPVTLQITD